MDAAGEIYIAASVVDMAAGPDARIEKFDPGGLGQWAQQYDGGVNAADSGIPAGRRAERVHGRGRPADDRARAAGAALAEQVQPTGQLVWRFTDAAPIAGAAVAMAGDDPVVVGTLKQAQDTDGLVRTYDEDGGEMGVARPRRRARRARQPRWRDGRRRGQRARGRARVDGGAE